MSNRFDNLSKLPEVHCPVFVARSATADRVVPVSSTRETLYTAANEPKHFFRDEGATTTTRCPMRSGENCVPFLPTIAD